MEGNTEGEKAEFWYAGETTDLIHETLELSLQPPTPYNVPLKDPHCVLYIHLDA